MSDRIRTRFLVVGSGVAGLHTAWRASAARRRAAAHQALAVRQRDGVRAGRNRGGARRRRFAGAAPAGHARRRRRALRRRGGAGARRRRPGARSRAADRRRATSISIRTGELKLGREAAHSTNRIVHAHGDQTGAEVARTLIARVQESKRIAVLETARVLDLIVARGACVGVRASVAGKRDEIIADATVLATGGCGQVYRYTTNPVVATGDGYAIAHRAGATLADMEFVQFHPTALDTPENPLALISEAVRGEGAMLVNERGERFMIEAAPARRARAARRRGARDLSRAAARGQRSISTRASSAAVSRSGFPGIFALCTARGIDPRKDLIPVTPAAHYMMGGIVTDLRGRSSLDATVRVGEVSRTGVHGANRLASNSLLEGLVFAERVARDMIEATKLTSPAAAAKWEVPRSRSRRGAGGRRRDSRR